MLEVLLEAGHCYRVLAAAPRMQIEVAVEDEHQHAVQAGATPAQPFCPRWTGPFFVRLRVVEGEGAVALRVLRDAR